MEFYLWKYRKIGEKEGERSQIACEEEIEGKMKENEEIRGLNDKKASEDLFMAFWQFLDVDFFYSLTLSYSWTPRIFLDLSSIGGKKAKEGQENKRK